MSNTLKNYYSCTKCQKVSYLGRSSLCNNVKQWQHIDSLQRQEMHLTYQHTDQIKYTLVDNYCMMYNFVR